MRKLILLACATSLASIVSQYSLAQPPMEKYNASCAVCHATGAAGAPMTHDVEAWKPRLDKGIETLVQSVNNGLNAMPPKGMCFDCNDDEYKAMIEFMATPAE